MEHFNDYWLAIEVLQSFQGADRSRSARAIASVEQSILLRRPQCFVIQSRAIATTDRSRPSPHDSRRRDGCAGSGKRAGPRTVRLARQRHLRSNGQALEHSPFFGMASAARFSSSVSLATHSAQRDLFETSPAAEQGFCPPCSAETLANVRMPWPPSAGPRFFLMVPSWIDSPASGNW